MIRRSGPPFARGVGTMHGPGAMQPRAMIAGRIGMIGHALFQRADANKDGKVSLNEVPQERREGFKKLLSKADKNHDQALSAEEARQMGAAIMQRLHGGHPQPARRPGPARGPHGQKPQRHGPKKPEAKK